MDPSNSQQQHHQHQQGMATHTTLEDVLNCTPSSKQQQQEHQMINKPQPGALKCPRCDSSNTKFSYYNNYSLIQPRYFCKACRRYWTKGGSLRNVPVGGGCRKNNKRTSPCSSSSPATLKAKSSPSSSISSHHHHQDYLNTNSIINPLLAFPSYDTNDLTLANHPGFIDALRNGFLDPSSGFFHDFYSSYGNGIGMGGDHHQHQQQQQVESNNNGGDCHEEDDQCMEQLVLPSYEEMGLTGTTPSTVTTLTKQELFKDGGTKVLWNFPWHGKFGGGGEQGNNNNHHRHHNNMGGVVDHSASGRDWNGFNGSSWHGLVNSPLM